MGTSWSTSSNYYIVQHQLQQTNGSYSTYETQVVAGKSGSKTAAVAKSYEGYVAQSITQQTIKANNSTVITVKYDTKPYKITYSGNGQTLSTATYSYGQTITDPGDPNVENFDFDGWYWDSSFTKPFEFGSATMPSKNITIYAKLTGAVNFSVSFDTMGHGEMPERQQVSIGGFATQPDDPVAESYRFDGWYADEHCVQEWDFLNDRIYADTIIYAKWTILAKDYWLAPASRITNEDKTNVVNPNYVNPETGVIRTHNEILADAELIKDGDNPTKLTYEDYMASDSIHLYTKIGEGTSEDDYMEFRIVNVGGHLCSGGIVDESDETGLTFQAIHALPEAYTVNATQTNEGGWLSSTLRSEMNSEGGSIYALFNEQLKTDAAKVKKYSRNGSAASTPSDTVGNGRDKFWLMSYCEVVGDPMSGWLNHNMEDEGDQYGYWQMMRPVNSGENKALLPLALTRSGNIVANATTQYAGSFWTRSSLPGDTRSFCYFNNSGNAEGMTANIKLAVTPCFAL